MNEMRYAAPEAGGFDAWSALYHEYAATIGENVDDRIARTIWRWLLDGTHRIGGVLAWDGRRLAGFVHYRPFPRTLHANEACFLDDLFVHEADRGRGLAGELIARVAEIARLRGWSEVRWVTSSSNERAMKLYERIARRDDLLTYRLPIGQSSATRR